MSEHDFLSRQFESHRRHLRAVAARMLGSAAEAEDAVQEAWLRVSRANDGAKLFLGRAQAAQPALIDGEVGLTVVPKGKLLLVLALTFDGDRISGIEAVADRASLAEMRITTPVPPMQRGRE